MAIVVVGTMLASFAAQATHPAGGFVALRNLPVAQNRSPDP